MYVLVDWYDYCSFACCNRIQYCAVQVPVFSISSSCQRYVAGNLCSLRHLPVCNHCDSRLSIYDVYASLCCSSCYVCE